MGLGLRAKGGYFRHVWASSWIATVVGHQVFGHKNAYPHEPKILGIDISRVSSAFEGLQH